MTRAKPRGRSQGRTALSSASFALALALMAAGCASEQPPKGVAAILGEANFPSQPLFLTGPAAVLLTNAGGFSARLAVTSASSSEMRPVSGQLVARGSSFFFEPWRTTGIQAKPGQFSYIWDAATNRGYVLSEALQGYAPLISTVRLTNLVMQGSPPTVEKIEGHPVERTTAVLVAADGKQSRFEVFRARDLGGLAIRISSIEDSVPFTIALSQVRLELPPEKLFLPPDGFTRYASQEALMNELAARQLGFHRKKPPGVEEAVPPGGVRANPPGGGP